MRRFVLCLICVLLVGTVCLSLAACSVYVYSDVGTFTIGGATLSGVAAVDIDWQQGSVTILPSQDKTVTFFESGVQDDEALQMRYLRKDGTLYIRFAQNGATIPSRLNKKLTVQLPYYVLDKLTVHSVSADVNVNGAYCREADINTTSGDVQLLSFEAASLRCETTSGSLQLWDVITDDVSIKSVSGNVLLTTSVSESIGNPAPQRASVATTSGDVVISTTEVPKNLQIDSTSGNIVVSFPKDTAVSLSSKTVSGKVTNRLTKGGNCFLDINTISGDITVDERK